MPTNRLKAEHRRPTGAPKIANREDARAIRLIAGNPNNGNQDNAARPMTVLDFQRMRDEGRKISMITCYDYSSARAVDRSSVDCILVGDSLAMTMHGFPNTLAATTEMMAMHTAAVARGASSKFIVGDMPFLSYRKGLKEAMDCVHELMSAGAHSVKLEGVRGHADIVRHIVVTVDNLTEPKVAERMRPTRPIIGAFAVTGTEDAPVLDPANYERYKPAVKMLQSVDMKQMNTVYARYYPLFQDAYESLGHPPKHQAGRGNITASNQGIRSLERRSDLTGVEVTNCVPGYRALGGRCGLRSAALQCTLISHLDVVRGRRHDRRCDSRRRDIARNRRFIFRCR